MILETKTDGLFLIDLPQPALEGFEQFISAWFFRDEKGRRMLVDPGPASTICDLCADLEKITDDLDYVLLTHIHLDHSGGVGQLLQKYPNAKILVSERGEKHLISPEKLWKASVETLDEVARAYGEPLPVPAESVLTSLDGVEIFETPGHAPHHISFRASKNLFFVGEAAGMTLPEVENYSRPATPARFDADAARESLDLLGEVCCENDILCYAHFGCAANARAAICAAKSQLEFWLDFVSESRNKDLDEIRFGLLKNDPLLANFDLLSEKMKKRELIFMRNSLQGVADWIERQK